MKGAAGHEAVLRSLGADDEVLECLAGALAGAPPGAIAGRVGRIDRGRFQLLTSEGPVSVATSGVSPVCVGDWCTAGAMAGPGGHAGTYAVREILPRRTALVRQSSGSRVESQALAANIDVVMVVVPLDREVSRRQVERFLALAWDSGARPVLVLTKVDLVEREALTAATAEVAAVSGDLAILIASAVSGAGVDEVAALAGPGRTVALLGTSGSGKSSLVNALMGSDVVQTGEVREADSKGRHTTTWRELVVIPDGGILIDTPGLRELGMWVDDDGIDAAFADVTELEGRCRFNDCVHDREPDCAVLAAIDDGTLDIGRLESYRKLLGEAASAARHHDRQLARENQRNAKRRR